MLFYLIIILTLFAAFLAALSQFIYKKKITNINNIRDLLNLIKNKFIIIGLLIYCFSLTLYLYVLSIAHDNLSITYSLFASVFIFVPLFSFFLLKEKLNSKRILGIILIFVGIVIISITI